MEYLNENVAIDWVESENTTHSHYLSAHHALIRVFLQPPIYFPSRLDHRPGETKQASFALLSIYIGLCAFYFHVSLFKYKSWIQFPVQNKYGNLLLLLCVFKDYCFLVDCDMTSLPALSFLLKL